MAPFDEPRMPVGSTATRTIKYTFFFSSEEKLVVDLQFDKRTHRLIVAADLPRPAWTRLACNRCPNCTLPEGAGDCPAAVALAATLSPFSGCLSYQKVVVEVETAARTIVAKTSLQSGLASLMGLVCATSGCPHTQFLRPMARFHLPFADEQETLFRSFATWLLAGHVRQRLDGSGTPPTLEGLKERYRQLQTVNASLAERLRSAVTKDAVLNAVIILDLFAQIAPDNIDGDFEDITQALVGDD